MKLTSLTTRLLVVLASMAALAFSGDNDSFRFSLSSSRIYAPGDPEISVEISGNEIGGAQVKFRAYRISNPVEFFLAQKDPHSPSLLAMTPPNTFEMIRQGFDKIGRDARYAARDVMPADARRAIRDVADLNGTKAEKREAARQKNPSKSTRRSLPSGDDIPKGAENYDVVTQWEHRVATRKEQWSYESVKVPIKEKGVYLIEARSRGTRAFTALVISEYGMVIKQANDRALAWVANRRSGEKVPGFELTVARAGKILAEKSTGGDGFVEVEVPKVEASERPAEMDPDEWRWSQRNRQLLVLGERDGNFVISDPYYYGDAGDDRQRIYLHTDRPVYRPAQKVFYRGIVRDVSADGTFMMPADGATVSVEVRDARDGVVRRDTLRLNDMGTFNGELMLGDEPPLGTYTVNVKSGSEEHWFNFAVEEYKKPEYRVEVTTDRGQYTRGDAITATVSAQYFFGSPVANAQVEYFVYRARYWRPWWRGSDWAYLYEESDDFYTYRMEMIQSQEATLEADGTLKITIPTDTKAADDYVYRIQANVVDNSRRSISGAKSVEVTRGEFYISTRTDKYVYRPGDDAKITVAMATFDGDRPVAAPFSVTVRRTWWDPVKVGDETEYKRRSQDIWTGSGSTDASGEGSVSYPVKTAGYFEVEVEAKDGRGTPITESSYIYVADQNYANWYREGSGDVQVIPDKQSYSPGETMSALVIMPAANVDALITAEGATLYRYSVERLTSNSAIVRMPIEERFAPVFYLNATTIVNDELYSEGQRITVVPQGKMIRLEVKTDKDLYRPADRGTVMVRATDERGRPVGNVDVALAMVDEAVYSIMPDATQDIQRFFYGNRWNEVATTSSLSFNFYGDARRIAEGDMLFGAAGASEMKAAAPSLASRDGARALAFGDVKGQMFVQPAMRRNFQDMMFWTPSARTGADGWAKLDVSFPDNLTTWRITARGVTRETAVGQTVARVVARKDLLVRMETPRFLVQGDEIVIATTVHNYLSSEKQTKVELTGTNVTLSESSRTITIPANGEQRLDWRLTAPTTGSTMLTVKALTNEESDAMELSVPVLPRGLRMTRGESAELDDRTASGAITLTLPETSEPTTGELALKITPSLAGSLLGALDELVGYPYGCVEQTMSRFLPSIVVAQTLRYLDVPFDQGKRTELPKMVQSGLSRLYGMQHDDGGWGWWTNDRSDAFMTAYVTYGLLIARRAGFSVDEQRQTRALDALRRHVFDSKPQPRRGERPANDRQSEPPPALDATTEAYALYVLSLASEGAPQKPVSDRIVSLARRDTLNNYSRALLALASRNAGLRPQANSLVTTLEASATESGGVTYWKGKGWHYTWQDDMVETSAFAVNAILAIKGETEQVKRGIRWLLSQREGDAWHNTRQTAMVIYALTDYLRTSRELEPDHSWVVKVNGREAGSGRFTRADVYGEGTEIRLDRSALRTGANTITFEKQGPGKLYAAARLSYYATGAAIQQASAGYRVSREYSLLRKERQGDIYVYTKRPFGGTVRTGDEIFVKVTVTPDAGHEYFMLEDPLPAGCEVITSTEGYTIPGEPMYDEKARQERGWFGWYWWYADREVRDEKVAFFARTMPAQQQEFTYIIRAQIPGKYSVMPSVGALMYYPEVRGNSGPIALTIVE